MVDPDEGFKLQGWDLGAEKLNIKPVRAPQGKKGHVPVIGPDGSFELTWAEAWDLVGNGFNSYSFVQALLISFSFGDRKIVAP